MSSQKSFAARHCEEEDRVHGGEALRSEEKYRRTLALQPPTIKTYGTTKSINVLFSSPYSHNCIANLLMCMFCFCHVIIEQKIT